jgi:hypothetical protein
MPDLHFLSTPDNLPYDVERLGDDGATLMSSPSDRDDWRFFRWHNKLRRRTLLLHWRREEPSGEESPLVYGATQLSPYSWRNVCATKPLWSFSPSKSNTFRNDKYINVHPSDQYGPLHLHCMRVRSFGSGNLAAESITLPRLGSGNSF